MPGSRSLLAYTESQRGLEVRDLCPAVPRRISPKNFVAGSSEFVTGDAGVQPASCRSCSKLQQVRSSDELCCICSVTPASSPNSTGRRTLTYSGTIRPRRSLFTLRKLSQVPGLKKLRVGATRLQARARGNFHRPDDLLEAGPTGVQEG